MQHSPRAQGANELSASGPYAAADPGYRLQFARDHGAHPAFRTEWWYLTAWLDTRDGPCGVQLTFFRSRTQHSDDNPSRFAPRQLLFAHAAVASPAHTGLLHADLAARAEPGMFSVRDTALQMRGQHGTWQLERLADDSYRAVATDSEFAFDLVVRSPFAPVLQGNDGFSQKGEHPRQASYYYSRPQLEIKGTLVREGKREQVAGGRGWLDHEWSSELLDAQATGWDWIGLNLGDQDALMAFRIRGADGTTRYAHARRITQGRTVETPAPRFIVRRQWQSPRTNVSYPVEMDVVVGKQVFRLQPLMDDQELDSRRSTGVIYWEGAVSAIDPATGRQLGRGYLELTGYAGKINF